MRSLVVAVIVVATGCEQRRTAPARAPAEEPAVSPQPPPPPPPPPAPSPQPPPAVVTSFLRAHAASKAPWRVTVSHDGVRRQLRAADAADLVRRLGVDTSYVDGDYGCVGKRIDYVIARETETFAFSENCGHMQIGEDDHAALFSPEMVTFLERTR